MKKILLTILIIVVATSCSNKADNYNKITINRNDSVKDVLVEINYTDTLLMELPISVPDSLILESIKMMRDSIKNDSIRRDSLHKINFRRITRIINGSYNGYTDREAIWLKAKEVIR